MLAPKPGAFFMIDDTRSQPKEGPLGARPATAYNAASDIGP